MPGFIAYLGEKILQFPEETRRKLICDQLNGSGWQLERRVVNKFLNDRIFESTEQFVIVVEGVVLNNHELMIQYKADNWLDCVISMYLKEGETFFDVFRGSFSGALYDKQADKWIVYTGHTGEKQVFWNQTTDNGILIGSEMRFVVETMKLNRWPVVIDEEGCYFSLTHGFCIEDKTLVDNVHKLIAGHYLRIQNGKVENIHYHRFSNRPVVMTQMEAVEGIDKFFRQAIRRAFEKDVEYGYRHIACLSGGLDSRMTVWVAHQMGYINQTNIDYCQSGYLDFSISQQIAIDLHHDYFFTPLDHGDFIPRYEFLPRLTYGSGFMLGHGYNLEQLINYEPYGIFHTGQIGDAVLGTFFKKNEYNLEYKVGQSAYSVELIERLKDYHFQEHYENEEIFCLYTRAFTGANQGLLTFQENTEHYSPFTDVDFLEFAYSIPLNLRFNHKIYIDWILDKYPLAAEYPWEKIRAKIQRRENYVPRTMQVLGYKVPHFRDPSFNKYMKGFVLRRLGLRKRNQKLKTLTIASKYNMNPVDYWYNTNPAVKQFMDSFWEQNHELIPNVELHEDMKHLFCDCPVYDKLQCLSVLSAIKLIVS